MKALCLEESEKFQAVKDLVYSFVYVQANNET